jgi:hypothetical protein
MRFGRTRESISILRAETGGAVGIFDRWKKSARPTAPVVSVTSPQAELQDEDDGRHVNWYVPRDRNYGRFIGADGLPCVRLIRYPDPPDGEILRFCDDLTGLIVGPNDLRLPYAGLLVSNLRGERYYPDSCKAGDFRPGVPVRLVPEPDNPHDDRAVAVYDKTGEHRASYMNKQKARAYLK